MMATVQTSAPEQDPQSFRLRFLQQRTQTDEIALVRLFRAWVREQIAKNSPT